MAVYVASAAVNLLIVVTSIYQDLQPSVRRISMTLHMLLKRDTVCKASLVIIGDVNVHLDDNTESTTVSFNDILEGFDLIRHIRGPTYTVMVMRLMCL